MTNKYMKTSEFWYAVLVLAFHFKYFLIYIVVSNFHFSLWVQLPHVGVSLTTWSVYSLKVQLGSSSSSRFTVLLSWSVQESKIYFDQFQRKNAELS